MRNFNMHAMITSRLDNGNALLVNVPSDHIQNLQRVPKCPAKIVVHKGKRHSISAILRELHWLLIKRRIDFRIVCITYTCLHGAAPVYLVYTSPGNQLLLCEPCNSQHENIMETGLLSTLPSNSGTVSPVPLDKVTNMKPLKNT